MLDYTLVLVSQATFSCCTRSERVPATCSPVQHAIGIRKAPMVVGLQGTHGNSTVSKGSYMPMLRSVLTAQRVQAVEARLSDARELSASFDIANCAIIDTGATVSHLPPFASALGSPGQIRPRLVVAARPLTTS